LDEDMEINGMYELDMLDEMNLRHGMAMDQALDEQERRRKIKKNRG
jgi:hypothetical protein